MAFTLLCHGHEHPHLLHAEVVLQGVLQLSSLLLLYCPLQVLHLGLDLWQRATLSHVPDMPCSHHAWGWAVQQQQIPQVGGRGD